MKKEVKHELHHLEAKVYMFAIMNNLEVNVDQLWEDYEFIDNLVYCLNVYLLAR